MIKAIVTDIEGTTSAIDFVTQVLFPYARERLGSYIGEHAQQPKVKAILQEVARIAKLDAENYPALSAELERWIDQDRKLTPLKSLQGMIWEHGYRNSDFRAHVYDDAVAQLQHWHRQGLSLYVYSSGSILAQKLFFGHSEAGDLRPLFSDYFDTTTGPKREAASYREISREIDMPAQNILFLSDIVEELDAAAEAGMHTAWLQREGELHNHPRHQAVQSFSDITLP